MEVLLGQFKKSLIASGLMTLDEVEAFVDSLPSDDKPKDGSELAKALVRQKKLTKFQAQAIFQGKTKGLIMGDYVVLDRIGEGGMGQVYKARHKVMKRVVALKTLPSEATKLEAAVRRFHREVEVAARLSHPNIVTAFDAGEAHGTHYLVMEIVEGSDLASYVRQHGRLMVQTALDFILQAARGLEYAHNRGVVHRDIKPSNLVLDVEGTVKVLDMGLARLNEAIGLDDSTGQQTLTGTGQAMGTIDYMPPEQAENVKTADERSDIYSLGCTLHYFLIGRSVYSGDTTVMRLLAHRDADIPSLRAERPDVPEYLDAVFQKMVAKKPEDRFASMTEVIAELEKCAAPKPDEFAETADLGSVPLASAHAETQSLLKSDETPGDESLMLGLPVVSPVETMRRRMPKKDNKVLYGAIGAVVCLLVLVVGLFIALKPAGEEVAGRDKTVSVEKKQVAEATTPRIDPKTNNGDQSPSTSVMPVVSTRSGTNWSLEFDGKTSYVQTPLKYDGTHPITIEAIVKPYETEGKADIVVNSSGTDGFYLIRYGAFLQIGTVARRSIAFVQSTSHVNSGQMMHLAAVIDNHEARLYFDGTTEVRKGDIVCRNGRSDVAVRLGATATLNTTKFWGFHGIIDEVRISNIARYTEDFIPQRRFEPDENTMALYHFDEGSGDVLKDSSGNGHDGKIVGAKWVSVDDELRVVDGVADFPAISPSTGSLRKLEDISAGTSLDDIWVSNDGKRIYYTTGKSVSFAEREKHGLPFHEPTALLEARHITLTADERRMIYRNDGTGDESLYEVSRVDSSSQFENPQKTLDTSSFPRLSGSAKCPHLWPDGLRIYFQAGDNSEARLYVMSRPSLSSPWRAPELLPVKWDYQEGVLTNPFLTDDGKMLICCAEGRLDLKLMVAHRDSDSEPFGDFKPIYTSEGKPLYGRAPFFVEKTGELFFACVAPTIPRKEWYERDWDWDIWVLEDFALGADKETTESTSTDMQSGSSRTVRWILSLGGEVTVRINGRKIDVQVIDDLPSEPFEIERIIINGESASGKDESLKLGENAKYLNDLEHVNGLYLHHLFLSDTDLQYIGRLTNLQLMAIQDCKIASSDLAHFQGLQRLGTLNLDGSSVDDVSIEHLGLSANLESLNLNRTNVTNKCLSYLRQRLKLQQLFLDETSITDAGIENVAALPVTRLSLKDTQITDQSIKHLKKLKNLSQIYLSGTAITKAGIAELQAAFPKCDIVE